MKFQKSAVRHSPRIPTIKDVAKKSGVSLGTASNVLSGKVFVQEGTAEKVRRAATELGYQKNHSAALLVSRKGTSSTRTGNIGLVFTEMATPWSEHPLASAYFIGVESACRETDFQPLVEFLGGSDAVPRCVRDGRVDGLVVKFTRAGEKFFLGLPKDLPVVAVGPSGLKVPVHQVSANDEAGGFSVAEYLWSKGHRRIGFVSTDAAHPMFQLREAGFERFLKNVSAWDPKIVWKEEKSSDATLPENAPPILDEAVVKLFSTAEKPTALVAANDWIAAGLYRALKKAGLRVGEDVSVVGFDNTANLCVALEPALTSFQIPFASLAGRAAEILLER
ncbi:MAG: LacI family DNA-binding transcriptional regulator, partial [Spirochaetia bacterium]|nr:LacI family DNA-binding transcriptional regulator [Spirochaetia bacterium]